MSLKGSLSTIALPEVLQFLAGTAKTGDLHVSGSGADGHLWLHEGRICGYSVGRSEDPDTAVFELLRGADGEFSFAAGAERPEDAAVTDAGVEETVARAQERLQVWAGIVAVVPSLQHWVSVVAEAPADTVSLTREEWALVVAVGEGRSVGDVLAARGMHEFEGSSAIRDMVEAGFLVVAEPRVVESPVDAPAVEEPAAEDAVAVEPVTEEPVAEEPAAEEPAAEEPVAEEPVAEEAVAEETPVEEPAAGAVAPEFSGLTTSPFPVFGGDEHSTNGHSFDHTGDMNGFASANGSSDHHEEESEPEADDDRWAALRAVVVEVDEALAEQTAALAEEQAEVNGFFDQDRPEHLPGVRPVALPDHGRNSDEEPTDAAEPAPASNEGRAALAALLAEVSALPPEEVLDEDVVADEHPLPSAPAEVDGLADRGPWTAGELATFDGWAGEEEAVAADEEPEAEAVESPSDQPLNRGLLLKFLSSVRN